MISSCALFSGASALLCLAATAGGAIEVFTTSMDGPSESPPVASPGTGFGTFTYDDVARTLRMQVTFENLVGTTTVAHIHAPTASPFAGLASVAVQPPSLTGFPTGVTSGVYDQTFDLTLATTYSASFVTSNGGTTASAEAALLDFMRTGRAYFNIHSTFAGGGEIRGFIPAPGAALGVGLGMFALRRRR